MSYQKSHRTKTIHKQSIQQSHSKLDKNRIKLQRVLENLKKKTKQNKKKKKTKKQKQKQKTKTKTKEENNIGPINSVLLLFCRHKPNPITRPTACQLGIE